MQFSFPDPSNAAIDRLVELGDPETAGAGSSVLTIPRFDELAVGFAVKDELREDSQATGVSIDASSIFAHPFRIPSRVIPDLVVTVDTSVLPLGEMRGGGVAFAIRGTAICSGGQSTTILRYSTGALLVTKTNKLELFRFVGEQLGSPNLYVELVDGRLREKLSAVDNTNRIQDRCRSFVERMIQEEALAILAANNGGLLLVDGAMTASFDTPVKYLRDRLTFAKDNRIEVCAVSKRTGVSVGGTPIGALFDEDPSFVGYAPLLDTLREERDAYGSEGRSVRAITEGTQIFAARFGFGPPGLTYRVDVSKTRGATDDDIMNTLYSRCVMHGGYPRYLIDAHQYSSFLGGEALSLLADLVVRSGAKVKEDPSMNVLFQPFGAFGK